MYSLHLYKSDKLRIQRFIAFRNQELQLSDKVYTTPEELRELNSRYDCFITGSDQLWNCETEINYPFYLGFVNEKKKRISYAPSFGSDSIPQKFEEEVTQLLNRYEKLSVREKSGADIVERLTGKKISVVIDPVFLHTEEQWVKKLGLKKRKGKKTVFVYTTEKSFTLNLAVKRFQKEHLHYEVYTPFAIPGVRAKILKDIGPKEFLDYVYNADFIITNSFHATAFALIFEKPFCAVKHSTRFARVRDLLSELSLQRYICENAQNDLFIMSVDKDYKDILEKMIDKSKAYLIDALQN